MGGYGCNKIKPPSGAVVNALTFQQVVSLMLEAHVPYPWPEKENMFYDISLVCERIKAPVIRPCDWYRIKCLFRL